MADQRQIDPPSRNHAEPTALSFGGGGENDTGRDIHNRILVVDDERAIREALREYLTLEGYDVETAEDGIDAVERLVQREFDVVITDLSMPNMDGFGLIKNAQSLQPFAAVIVLSGQDTFSNAIEAVHRGAYDFVAKPVRDFKAFKITVDRGLEHKSLLTGQANYQANLEKQVAQQTRELARTNRLLKQYADQLESVSLSVISTFLSALEEKDRYTAGHSRRVTHLAVGAAGKLGIIGHDLWRLHIAGQLHDMGKLMIDLSYVNKPGPLTEEEWDIMKEHPAMADRFLAPLPFLEDVRPIIRHHHERLDGSGYPDGLSGDEVDLLTQILAVADSYDAMTSRRSYRDSMTGEAAMEELWRGAEVKYGRAMIEALAAFLESPESKVMEAAGDRITTPITRYWDGNPSGS